MQQNIPANHVLHGVVIFGFRGKRDKTGLCPVSEGQDRASRGADCVGETEYAYNVGEHADLEIRARTKRFVSQR